VQEWAEVHRLFHRERCPKAEIAERLGKSRTTVYRLLALKEPPQYEREQRPSLLDPHKAKIGELLALDAEAPASVVIDHLRRQGYQGGDHDPQGLPSEDPLRVPARPGTPAHQLPPGPLPNRSRTVNPPH
jgi:hypothetical protein